MKKLFRLSFIPVIISLCIAVACKKTDTVDDILSGNGDYLEFKVDGTSYRIETSGVNSSDYVQSVTTFHHDSTLNTNSVIISLAHIKNLSSGLPPSALFQITQLAPLSTGNYNLAPLDSVNPSDTVVTFVFVKEDSTSFRFLTGFDNSGSIQVTTLNNSSGGKVEGTFNFNNVKYYDKSNQVISSGHVVSEGKFRSTKL